MINILICDDEVKITNKVCSLINEIKLSHNMNFDVDVKNSSDFILNCSKSYDIAILDIEMPVVNGLDMAERLKLINSDIIIIVLTSYSKYLDSAMKIQVFRYLSKPIEKERFIRNFSEALSSYKELSKEIIIQKSYEVFKIKTKDILYIENKKHGSIIKTKYDLFITNKKPQEWFEIINQPNCFVYSHKSYIVNMQNVINFNKNFITFCDNTDVHCISQRKFSDFKKAFFNFAGDIK
ncbi:MAG: response regulator transcription factor [Oscillospiraceae bacterium]|nr:response regulator transcription factor [Oscillospiraceae bacterium]